MRLRLLIALVCSLLGVAALGGPAFAAAHHTHRHAASTTTSTTSTTTGTGHHHRHHAGAGHGKGKHHGGASTGSANKVLNDCQAHAQLTHSYTKAELRQALAQMSAATKQYSNCYDVIQQALLHTVKSGPGSGGSSGSSTTIIIVIVVVLVALAALFGGLAVRRRRSGGPGGPAGPGPAAGPPTA